MGGANNRKKCFPLPLLKRASTKILVVFFLSTKHILFSQKERCNTHLTFQVLHILVFSNLFCMEHLRKISSLESTQTPNSALQINFLECTQPLLITFYLEDNFTTCIEMFSLRPLLRSWLREGWHSFKPIRQCLFHVCRKKGEEFKKTQL